MTEGVEATTRRQVSGKEATSAKDTAATVPWRSGFGGSFSSVLLATQRLGKSWRLSLAVALGMVVAVALLATAPFYNDLVASAQLQSALTSSAAPDRDIQIDVSVASLFNANLPATDKIVTSDARDYLAPILSGSTEYLDTTRPLALAKVDGKDVRVALPTYPTRKGAQDLPMAFDYAQAAPHMKLLAGRLPRDLAASDIPEVMVTPAMGVTPGAVLRFVDAEFGTFGFDARVVGVWFPKDENDPFWNGHGFDTVVVPNISNALPPQFPILFARSALVRTFTYTPTLQHPPTGVGLHYLYFVDASRMTVAQAKMVTENIAALRTRLGADVPGQNGAFQIDMATRLSDILGSVITLLAGQSLPLYSVDAELVTLALLFIFVMAGLLVESQAGEITTLKSRGASATQLLLIFLALGVLLAALSLAVGMAVAGGLALALVRYFVPLAPAASAALSPAYVARSLSLRHALLPAGVGATLSVVALGLAAWQAARMDALTFRREQGRSARIPFWKRYYLDLGLAVLCIAGYMELATFGGLATRTQLAGQSGASQFDIIQLAAPTLMLLAGALLVQRVTPLLLRLGAWLTMRGRGMTGMLAFAQVSRASSAFNRLTLLLTLAVGLGLFALTFQTTLARGATDDAYYLTGADERLVIKPPSAGTQSTLGYATQFARLAGVESVTAMYRGVALTSPDQGGQNVDVLAVDPTTFARTATWRDDYASQSLPSLMRLLAQAPSGVTAGEAAHPMVALIDQTYANNFQLRVGQRFQLSPQEAGQANTGSSAYFVVGAIVNDFPTLYDEYSTGYIVVDLNAYLAVLANPTIANYPVNGPNEFLLRTTASPGAARQRATALADPNFFVDSTLDARALAARYRDDPLSAGMAGLLFLGALIAALLALVGVLTQAGVAARRRQTQFAILRTLGLGQGALTAVLLTEQALVYALGALGGVAIGALLAVSSLPFLGFNTATYAPPVVGVPPGRLAVNLSGSLVYLGALLLIFAGALVVAAWVARRVGLGNALRVGED